jgi:hypothetical protein
MFKSISQCKIEDVNDTVQILKKYPMAAPALNESITVEVMAGETLFIPAFTWAQKEWTESGVAVNQFGWADGLTTTEELAMKLFKETWKLTLIALNSFEKEIAQFHVRKILSLGRHPTRSVFAGSPVSSFVVHQPLFLAYG